MELIMKTTASILFAAAREEWDSLG